MGTIYIDTGGALTNSGSTDQNGANLTGSAASVAGAVVTLDGSPDLSALVTSGATQSSIYIADATNTNMKIFWITAFDDTLNTVTVSVAPTGVTSSVWNIGGRILHSATSVGTLEGAVRAGDTVIFNNSPAPIAGAVYTFRIAGDTVSGHAKIKGKTGVRPALTTTGTANCVVSAVAYSWMENLEIIQQGGSGNAISLTGNSAVMLNVKVSDAGGSAVQASGAGTSIINCEIGGGSILDGINYSGSSQYAIVGNYIHDVGGDGIEITGATSRGVIINNIIDTAAARGIFFSAATTANAGVHNLIYGNTVYGCGNSGLESTDADTTVILMNNIFMNNGDAGGEYNVEWVAGGIEAAGGYHSHNCFHDAGAGDNLLGLTSNSTEITTDPLFNNAAAGDFSLQSGSPCKATGSRGVFLGGSTGYLDMGAVQRQEPAGGSSAARVIGG